MSHPTDDSLRHIHAFNQLIADHPHLPMHLVHQVLQAHHYDHKLAYETICEMLIPPESAPALSPPKSPTPPPHSQLTYAPSPPPQPLRAPPPSQQQPSCAPPPLPRGVWAHDTMARRHHLNQLCTKYPWMPRARIRRLLHSYHGCIELVEEDILHSFPIDQPHAFASTPSTTTTTTTTTNAAAAAAAASATTRQQALAESLRRKDAAEIHHGSTTALHAAAPSHHADTLLQLRQQLWQQRELLCKANVLASHTRKQTHHNRAKQIETEVHALSTRVLECLRRSDQYKNGVIDLHGLTKEEAIQLVQWKLSDAGRRRFRVITGKGIHSHNEQAVLRPALEKHFRSQRISFTPYQDGVLSVIPK